MFRNCCFHRPSVWVLLVELCQADLHDLVGHLWNHSTKHCPLDKWFDSRKLPELSPFWYIAIKCLNQLPQSSPLSSSFSGSLSTCSPSLGCSSRFPWWWLLAAENGLSLTWANLQFFSPMPLFHTWAYNIPWITWCVGSSELENMNDTFGASCQWIFGLLSLAESLHP